MEVVEDAYCRFCAELRGPEKLLNLLNDSKMQVEVMAKLTFLNATYVDVSDGDCLPKTICFICYDSLNKAYAFLEKVKSAQHLLTSIFTRNEVNKIEFSDDDILDEIYSPEPGDEPTDIKIETSTDAKLKIANLEVKSEPQDESLACDTSNEMLNVQELFDAAICNAQYTSTVTMYAKEMTDITKKEISNWSDYPWVCSFCSIEFINMEMLRAHAKMVHGKCSAHFCIDCKKGRKDNFSGFIKHVRKHRRCLRKFCHYCNHEVESLSELKQHLKTKHYQKPKLTCPLCGEIQMNEEMLKVHIHQFSPVKTRRPRRKPGTPYTVEELTCNLCKKVYKNPNSLRDHMKLHTLNRKREYTCDRCGKMFFNKGTLTSHIMSHDKIRPHVCRICNKSFLFPNMLRRHVEMHSGIKPYSCEQCGRCFRLQYQLKAHKIVHTDRMPYICQYCNKAFRFKQILKNHERQHTGAKPYSCQNCGMEFTNWSNYNKHMKRRHNTDTSKKKITPEGVFPVNPETGQIIQVIDPEGTEEWKNKIMVPGKRGKKKVIKKENVD